MNKLYFRLFGSVLVCFLTVFSLLAEEPVEEGDPEEKDPTAEPIIVGSSLQFEITYGSSVPEEAKTIFQYAVADWAGILVGSVPVKISVDFLDMGESLVKSTALVGSWNNTSYAYPLLNNLCGYRVNEVEEFDCTVKFNLGTTWNYSTNNPAGDDKDFYAAALRGITHCLGFGAGNSYRDHLYIGATGEKKYSEASLEERIVAQEGDGNVYWGGINAMIQNQGNRIKIFASNDVDSLEKNLVNWDGSVDFSSFMKIGDPSCRVINPRERGLMKDIGWRFVGDPVLEKIAVTGPSRVQVGLTNVYQCTACFSDGVRKNVQPAWSTLSYTGSSAISSGGQMVSLDAGLMRVSAVYSWGGVTLTNSCNIQSWGEFLTEEIELPERGGDFIRTIGTKGVVKNYTFSASTLTSEEGDMAWLNVVVTDEYHQTKVLNLTNTICLTLNGESSIVFSAPQNSNIYREVILRVVCTGEVLDLMCGQPGVLDIPANLDVLDLVFPTDWVVGKEIEISLTETNTGTLKSKAHRSTLSLARDRETRDIVANIGFFEFDRIYGGKAVSLEDVFDVPCVATGYYYIVVTVDSEGVLGEGYPKLVYWEKQMIHVQNDRLLELNYSVTGEIFTLSWLDSEAVELLVSKTPSNWDDAEILEPTRREFGSCYYEVDLSSEDICFFALRRKS